MMLRIASVIAFCALLSEASFMSSFQRTDIQDILPADQPALVARYVVNQADYAAVATISTQKDIDTYPVAKVIAYSDGPIGNGTGIPYMYITFVNHLNHLAQDLEKDNRATLLMSLAETTYCQIKQLDAMDPRCPSVMLTGKFAAVEDTAEYKTEEQLFFKRHPKLKDLFADRTFYFAKFLPEKINLIYNFDGPKNIPVDDYLRPPVYHK